MLLRFLLSSWHPSESVCNQHDFGPGAYQKAVTVEVASKTLVYEVTVAFTTVVETVVTAMYWLQKAFALEQYRSW